MAIIRWNPIAEMEVMRRQMDRLFDEMVSFEKVPTLAWKPAIELLDGEDALTLKVALPGVEAKDVDISVNRESVTLKGERHYNQESQDNGYYHSEFRYGSFERSIRLPIAIENDQVQADYTNGILTLTLPKVREAVNKTVKVNLVNQTPAPETAAVN